MEIYCWQADKLIHNLLLRHLNFPTSQIKSIDLSSESGT